MHKRYFTFSFITFICLAGSFCVFVARSAPRPPFRFLQSLQLADAPFPTSDQRGHRCEYIYSGRADYRETYARAVAELSSAGWKRDAAYPFAKDGCRFIKAAESPGGNETWVMLKRDARVEKGSAGRLVTSKVPGWISVRCLIVGDAPTAWDRLRSTLHL